MGTWTEFQTKAAWLEWAQGVGRDGALRVAGGRDPDVGRDRVLGGGRARGAAVRVVGGLAVEAESGVAHGADAAVVEDAIRGVARVRGDAAGGGAIDLGLV